jgi:hypothetical protein
LPSALQGGGNWFRQRRPPGVTRSLQYMGHRLASAALTDWRSSAGAHNRRQSLLRRSISSPAADPSTPWCAETPRCWMARFCAELEATAVKPLRGLVARCTSAQGPRPVARGWQGLRELRIIRSIQTLSDTKSGLKTTISVGFTSAFYTGMQPGASLIPGSVQQKSNHSAQPRPLNKS